MKTKTRITLRANSNFSSKLKKVKEECGFKDNSQALDFLISIYEEISRFTTLVSQRVAEVGTGCQTLTDFRNAYGDNNSSKQKNGCQTLTDQTQLNPLKIKDTDGTGKWQTTDTLQKAWEATGLNTHGEKCQTMDAQDNLNSGLKINTTPTPHPCETEAEYLSSYILTNLEAIFRLLYQQVEGEVKEKIAQTVGGLTLCLFAQKVQTRMHKRCRQECTKGADRSDLEPLIDKDFPEIFPSYIYKEDSFKEGKEYTTNTSPYGEVLVRDKKFVPENKEGEQQEPGKLNLEKDKSKRKEKACPPIYVKDTTNNINTPSESGSYGGAGSHVERIMMVVEGEGYDKPEELVNKVLECIEYWEKLSGLGWDSDSDYRLLELLSYLSPKRIMKGMEQMVRESEKKGEPVKPFRYYVSPILNILRKAYAQGEESKKVKYFGVVHLDRSRVANPKWVISEWNKKVSEDSRLLPAQYSLPLVEAIRSLRLSKKTWKEVMDFLPDFLEVVSFQNISLSQLVMSKTKKGTLWIYWVIDELSKRKPNKKSLAPSTVCRVVPAPLLDRLREQSKKEGLYEALRDYLRANNVKVKPHGEGERAIVYFPVGDVPRVLGAFLLAKWEELRELLSAVECHEGGES